MSNLKFIKIILILISCLAFSLTSYSEQTSGNETELNGDIQQDGHGYAAQIMSELSFVGDYLGLAIDSYGDAFLKARKLKFETVNFLNNPSDESLETVRESWIVAQQSYGLTEVFRFGNPEIDEWEGRVNAWPIDESLIDYVDVSDSLSDNVNIIKNREFLAYGKRIDAKQITPEFLRSLNELDGVESNVSTGYHAIEFLLWGQDLNGSAHGPGFRRHTDYDLGSCTNGNCQRRRDYLESAVDLLLADIKEMLKGLDSGVINNRILLSSPEQVLVSAFQGMVMLSSAELAGERIRLALLSNDPEETHNCFSDTTHLAVASNHQAVKNQYLAGNKVSVAKFVEASNHSLHAEILQDFLNTDALIEELLSRATKGETMDILIASSNESGNQLLTRLISSLVKQSRSLQKAAKSLNLTI